MKVESATAALSAATAFQVGGSGSIPGWARNFNSNLGSGTGSTQPREQIE